MLVLQMSANFTKVDGKKCGVNAAELIDGEGLCLSG